ncbi:MAG: hypothetical protein ACPGRD_10250, partial [Planktomarina sp.]
PDAEVMADIYRVQAAFVAASHTAGEDILVNEDTQKAFARVKTDLPQHYLQDGVDRMRDVMEVFDLDGAGQNQYSSLLSIRDMLNRAVERNAKQPQRLHDTCLSVVRMVQSKAKLGDCPEVAGDANLIHLIAELVETADDFYKHDDQVKICVDARATTREPADETPDVSAVAEQLATVTEGSLRQELIEDAAMILSPQTPWIVRRHAIYRFSVRAFRIMSLGFETGKTGLKATAEIFEDISKITQSVAYMSVIAYLLSYF